MLSIPLLRRFHCLLARSLHREDASEYSVRNVEHQKKQEEKDGGDVDEIALTPGHVRCLALQVRHTVSSTHVLGPPHGRVQWTRGTIRESFGQPLRVLVVPAMRNERLLRGKTRPEVNWKRMEKG